MTRRLNLRRNRIAELLSINPEEGELRPIPPECPDGALANDVTAFIRWREARPIATRWISRADCLIEDLTDALCLSYAFLRDVNRAASDPQVAKNLRYLICNPTCICDLVSRTDPNTRGIIEAFLSEGRQILETGDHPNEEVLAAAEAALASLQQTGPGRPKGSVDHASRCLAERLAEIFERYCGRPPTRRVDPVTHAESGEFRNFVTIVLSVVPRRLLQYKSAPPGSVTKSADHIVRLSVESRKPKSACDRP